MLTEIKCPQCNGIGTVTLGYTLGKRLAYLRARAGMSRMDVVSELAGRVTKVGLHNIETGKSENPSVHTVVALARLYGVKLDDLL